MRFLIAALAFVCLSFGQSAARVYQFKPAQTVQEMQEIATVIRSIADIKELSVDAGGRQLSVRGPDPQIALADWLFNELDKSPDTVVHEYRVAAGPDSVVRLFYLPGNLTVQDFQEIVTTVRSITEIRRAVTYNTPRAVVLRGTPEQLVTAEWMLTQLSGTPTNDRFTVPGTSDAFVRVLTVPNTPTVVDFDEIATLVKALSDIGPLFRYNRARAIALRGTSEQIGLAEWLIKELDGLPAPQTASAEYLLPSQTEGVVKVFYLRNIDNDRSFQQAATFIRSTSRIGRSFTYTARRALAFRGTSAQIANAERLINERK